MLCRARSGPGPDPGPETFPCRDSSAVQYTVVIGSSCRGVFTERGRECAVRPNRDLISEEHVRNEKGQEVDRGEELMVDPQAWMELGHSGGDGDIQAAGEPYCRRR